MSVRSVPAGWWWLEEDTEKMQYGGRILEDTEKQWEDKLGGKTNKSLISWEEYRSHVFGFIDDDKPESGYNFRQGGNGVFG